MDFYHLKAEHDENEIRKGFTVSERVAIGNAIKEKFGRNQGRPLKKDSAGALIKPVTKSRTEIAKEAGFSDRENYRRAKKVVENGTLELVEAVDKGDVSIQAGALIAKLPSDEQKEVIGKDRTTRPPIETL
ncbi:MAG: hypothetical protein HQL72_14025 [Magnetococcales bacterium]|nr:hypothetical protein [Magnetococcales bacterium]